MGTGDGKKTPEGHLNHGGYWREENEWPLERAQFQTLYLHDDGSLDSFETMDDKSSVTYKYDPEKPVPTVGGQLVGMFKLKSRVKC